MILGFIVKPLEWEGEMVNEEKRLLKVFLCHASGDKPPVRQLYKDLVAEGVDAWLDQEKLLPGQDWRLEIPRAVREADVVVICLSKKSITKEGYIQKEIRFALDIAEEKPEGTIFLIPARLEDCTVPERLGRWQWVDLYDENGFLKLLRSLKLRANKVGAVIEPISYEVSDEELKRRLDQLYTDGLAAFYTEDWDKACFYFQKILGERPNHRNAAEKLAEAECQRKLEKLYGRAKEAVQAENWQVAIETLEELLNKSADYKDAPQLLRDAQKRGQLRELYTEARALYAAQKWKAVVRVFDQISVIEPNFPDPDGLLASAKKEVAEVERLADLHNQYSRALREMDTANWHEARRLLESVHKAQTGFLETEKLLRKVEDEISRDEDKRRQNDQINTLYEQAHGLLRAKKWRNALDKLEQIRKLDEQFPDGDGITEKAQNELQREEQEAERQNKLAALYAEAVRLLKDKNYQDALNKWQEVKALDPMYPDRQSVQRTIKQKLAKSRQPLQFKPSLFANKRLWMGILGFVVVALVVTGVILLRGGTQKGSLALASGAPQKTNTPRAQTPASELDGSFAPTMYDDFESSQYEGRYDSTKWAICEGEPAREITQSDGILTLAHPGTPSGMSVVRLCARKYQNVFLAEPTYFEADLMLPSQQIGFVGISLAINGIGEGGTSCFHHYFYSENSYATLLHCNYVSESEGVNWISKDKNVTPGTWHTVRMEVLPATREIVYYLDGQNYDVYRTDKDFIKRFSFVLHVTAQSSGTVVGYIDNVKIGRIAD